MSTGPWILKSSNEALSPDIPLTNIEKGEVVIGRAQLQNCNNSQYLSTQHCSFQLQPHGEGLLVKSLAKFDVIFVNGVLLKKGDEVAVKNNTKLILCQKLFKYTLYQLTPPVLTRTELNSPQHKQLNDSSSDIQQTKQVRMSDMGPPLPRVAFTSDTKEQQEVSQKDRTNFNHRETENTLREGNDMALADIESMVCMRNQSALTVTKALCRTLLSSFHCDICLEVSDDVVEEAWCCFVFYCLLMIEVVVHLG